MKLWILVFAASLLTWTWALVLNESDGLQNDLDCCEEIRHKISTSHIRIDVLDKNKRNAKMNFNLEASNNSCCRLCCNGQIADCSQCNLTEVPQDLPENIAHLLLPYNKISSSALYPGVFAKYSKLLVLQMDSNNLTVLPNRVFDNLSSLIQLNLYNNSIRMDSQLRNSFVFLPLRNTLKYLVMNRNTPDTSSDQLMYPDLALSVLTKLTVLNIDGLNGKPFGSGFSTLRNLRNLTISGFQDGNCNIVSINNDTFRFLTSLHHLNISDCGLIGGQISKSAFEYLTELKSLDVSNNFDLGLEAVGRLMFSFRNSSNLIYLKLQRVVNRFASCIIVYKHTLRHFKNTSLEVIEAMDNEIEMIQYGAIQMLPTTLRTLNLTNNRIMFGAYWKDMGYLTRLQSLHLDGFRRPYKFPQFFPSGDLNCKRENIDDIDENGIDQKSSQGQGSVCLKGHCRQNEPFILQLPPSLTNFTMHSNSLAYTVNNISFSENNTLEHADVSGNTFPTLIGPITGLNHLKSLDMSICFIDYITASFFNNLTHLQHLNLYQNLLAECLNLDCEITVFHKLSNLTYLNISFNYLYRLNRDVFITMTKLEFLDLSVNTLSHANFSITHMENLKLLDLHKNDIASLPPQVTRHITGLMAANKTIRVDMRQNPISCDCENLEFLQWVVETGVFGDNYTHYYCKYPVADQAATEMVNGYEDVVRELQRRCTTHVGLFVGVIGSTFLMVIILAVLVIYRFR
ncbi:unnamed protein product [Lymnaea stagnalis]|uniref:Uncharacterized protein n=1 Tax=Lymnaea stagnalis TaxID=6523 RepID=A0AAV2HRZ0_LYMST